MTLFQGIVLTPLTFMPSNTMPSASKPREVSLAATICISEMDESSTISRTQSPTYVPSSHTTSPNLLLFSEPQLQYPPSSPCTIANALEMEANINAITLWGIATSLVSTIRVREEHHIKEKRCLKEQIAQLKACIEAHKENF
jgi:hypothetical protein